MEREEVVAVVPVLWAIAVFVVLAPALLWLLFIVITTLPVLIYILLTQLMHPRGTRLAEWLYLFGEFGKIIGGCVGLSAVWLGALAPDKVQRNLKLKIFSLIGVGAGIAAVWGFVTHPFFHLPPAGWHALGWYGWWSVLGPVVIGVCGLYRISRSCSI
jgi:hypothetical protein